MTAWSAISDGYEEKAMMTDQPKHIDCLQGYFNVCLVAMTLLYLTAGKDPLSPHQILQFPKFLINVQKETCPKFH